MEIKMRKTVLTILGALLITGSAVQVAAASNYHVYSRGHVQSDYRGAPVEGDASTFCSTDPGNPYNPQTDYQGWSAWRQSGAWDSRNDCQ
jgi:hypothetical protein